MAIVPPNLNDNYLLNNWPRVMLESIPTFNQVSGKGAPLKGNRCAVYIQPDRDTIANALDVSINKMAHIMKYWPMPKWFKNTMSFGAGVPLRREIFQTFSVKNGGSYKLIEFGQRATSIIQAGAAIVYSDVGGYGVFNTATITVPAGVLTDVNEVQLFFQLADQQANAASGAGLERYQITPIQVTLTGGNFVITAPRALFVKPTIWATPYLVTDPNLQDVNAANNGNASTDFVTAVDVYRVYNDNTTQIEVLDWNNVVLDKFNAVIVNDLPGLFTFENTCLSFLSSCCANRPTRLRVSYRAGEPLVNGFMNNDLELAIIRLANVFMPVELCTFCAATKNMWNQDRNPSIKDRYPIMTRNATENEFGFLTNGTIYAYNVAVDNAISSGAKLTHNWI